MCCSVLCCAQAGVTVLRDDGCVSSAASRALQPTLRCLFALLRPHLVALVDAFALPDVLVRAPIGAMAGKPHSQFMHTVLKANL
jgi:hypothetical protein